MRERYQRLSGPGKETMSVTHQGWLPLGIAVVAALLTATACSSSNTTSTGTTSAATSVSASSASASEVPNQQDVMFLQQMIPHHQQAIAMSDIILAKQNIDNINPRVSDLATHIKAAQGPEIQQMQGWLSQWGEPTMPMMPGMPGMPDHSGMPGMNGMMSDQEMAALKDAHGVEASKLFLTQMIRHHQGAVVMAQNEITSGQNPSALALAHAIATSQHQEINNMQAMLATL